MRLSDMVIASVAIGVITYGVVFCGVLVVMRVHDMLGSLDIPADERK